MSMEANFDGWCPACQEKIYEGDQIEFSTINGGWCHEECRG